MKTFKFVESRIAPPKAAAKLNPQQLGGIVIEVGGDLVKIEAKRWNTWRSGTFVNQFLKDLQNMSTLGSHKWIFANTSGIADMAVLKNNVLSTLATKVNGNWVPKSGVFDGVDLLKMQNLIDPNLNVSTKNQAIIDWLSVNFDSIFEIF